MVQSQLKVIPGPRNLIVIVDDQSTSRAILEQVVRGVDANVRVEAFESPVAAVNWATMRIADLVGCWHARMANEDSLTRSFGSFCPLDDERQARINSGIGPLRQMPTEY